MKSAKWENIFKGWNNKESETVHTLKKVPVFKNLSEKDFSELEKMMHQRSYASGEFIFKNKAPGEGMYIICLLYTSPSPRDQRGSRMPSSA